MRKNLQRQKTVAGAASLALGHIHPPFSSCWRMVTGYDGKIVSSACWVALGGVLSCVWSMSPSIRNGRKYTQAPPSRRTTTEQSLEEHTTILCETSALPPQPKGTSGPRTDIELKSGNWITLRSLAAALRVPVFSPQGPSSRAGRH